MFHTEIIKHLLLFISLFLFLVFIIFINLLFIFLIKGFFRIKFSGFLNIVCRLVSYELFLLAHRNQDKIFFNLDICYFLNALLVSFKCRIIINCKRLGRFCENEDILMLNVV
jgi:hypothetical protein